MENPRLFLKKPEREWLWIGACIASALPVIWGIGILLQYKGYFIQKCYAKILTKPCHKFSEADVFNIPIGFTLIFGTALAAFLGCRYVIKNNAKGFRSRLSFVGIGVKSALMAHAIFAILHIWYMMGKPDMGGSEVGVVLVVASLFIHPIIWLCITLPLSMFCGWIFSWFATER